MTLELVGFGSYASISEGGRHVAIDTSSGIYVYDRELVDLIPVSIFGGEGDSYPKISADGNFVAFISEADNLVGGDTNEAADVFIHNRRTGETERISVASDGTESNSVNFYGLSLSASGELAMGDDGRYVAFTSLSDNLVENDTNGDPDIFVRDRQTGETTRVSVASDGTEAESPTGYHTFYGSYDPAMSRDGRYVAFNSHADNLVAGDTNRVADIFVRDRQTGETTRVSVASDGTEAKGSEAEDIVWYVPEGGSSEPAISGDGRYVAFTAAAETDNLVSGDTNEASDIFVRDRLTGETTRVSVASNETEGNDDSRSPSISADGRYVTFLSRADNLVPGDTDGEEDVFVRDRETGITRKILAGASEASISADGLHIVATTDSGIFVADWQADGNTSSIPYTSSPFTVNGTYEPISGDFDGDRYGDILWYQPGRKADYLWSFDSDGSYDSESFTVNGDYTPVVGDFDGSGTTDILWYQPRTAADYLWSFNSDGSYESHPFTVNGEYEAVEGDFDGSGTTDILWYKAGSGTDYIWYFETDGSYNSEPFTVNGDYDPITGDFDGSGTTDIVWYKPGGDRDYLWSFNSDGTYQSEAFAVNGEYEPVEGDFDGNGVDDILWYQPGNGADYMWLFNPGGSYESTPFAINGVYEPVVEDFDGNNFSDILWYKAGTGSDYLWLFG